MTNVDEPGVEGKSSGLFTPSRRATEGGVPSESVASPTSTATASLSPSDLHSAGADGADDADDADDAESLVPGVPETIPDVDCEGAAPQRRASRRLGGAHTRADRRTHGMYMLHVVAMATGGTGVVRGITRLGVRKRNETQTF